MDGLFQKQVILLHGGTRMNSFHERFNTHNECLYSVIDYVYFFLCGQYADYEEIRNCRTWKDIYCFFQRKGIIIVCRCNPVFFINPISYYLCIKSYLYSRNNRPKGKIAVITFSSALEFYGINDLWTHYICETMHKSEHHLYDPYRKFIKEDYPGIEEVKLNHKKIREIKKFQFILWR